MEIADIIHTLCKLQVEAYLAHASAQEVLAVRRIIVAADSEQHVEEGEEVLHHTERFQSEVAAANHSNAHRDAAQSGYEQDAVQAELQQHRQRLQQQQQQQQQAAAVYNGSHGLYSGAGGAGPDQGDFHGGLNGEWLHRVCVNNAMMSDVPSVHGLQDGARLLCVCMNA